MKRAVVLVVLLLLTLACVTSDVTPTPATKAGGEILWEGEEGTLYRCGPSYEDICWDDGEGATKIYFGEDKK